MCQQSRACNSEVNSGMWPSFELVQYLIPVLFISKFHIDWIIIKQGTCMLQTKSNTGYFWHLRASNSKANSPILPELELVRDLMPVQVNCNFYKDQSKLKGLCSVPGQIWCFSVLKGK